MKVGVMLSIRCVVAAPTISPKTAINEPPKLIDGTNRLKAVAANITPAEKPSIISIVSSENCLLKKIGKAPIPVAKPASRLDKNPK